MYEVVMLIVVITQIVTESLPISSSGHVLLMQKLLQPWTGVVLPPMSTSFEHLLHGPTIVVVLAGFYKHWWSLLRLSGRMVKTWVQRSCSYVRLPDSNKNLIRLLMKIVGMVMVANLMTALLYVLIKFLCKRIFLGFDLFLLAGGFVVTMMLLLSEKRCAEKKGLFRNINWKIIFLTRKRHSRESGNPGSQQFSGSPIKSGMTLYTKGFELGFKRDLKTHLTLSHALILGCAQGIATFPGVSRFAITFVVARWLGLTPARALQWSFLLFFPLLCGAFFFSGLPMLVNNVEVQTMLQPSWLFVIGLATLMAYLVFTWVCGLAVCHQFWRFGWYMMLPIVLTFCF